MRGQKVKKRNLAEVEEGDLGVVVLHLLLARVGNALHGHAVLARLRSLILGNKDLTEATGENCKKGSEGEEKRGFTQRQPSRYPCRAS
jgi:hypothetical protein